MARASPPLPQAPSPAPPPFTRYSTPSPPVTVILTFVILIFFFVGFFSIYFCRCFFHNILNGWLQRHNPPPAPPVDPVKPALGLDPEIVKSFPTFNYSNVKGYRREKYGLECAICLIEFVDEDVLRLLTPCCHVFHQECIDLWLESHKTCPVCRRELDLAESLELDLVESPFKPCPLMRDMQEDTEDSFVITIKDDNDDGIIDRRKFLRQKSGGSQEKSTIGKFSKCHSTGHSIVIGNRSSLKDEGIVIQNSYNKKEKGIVIGKSYSQEEKGIVLESSSSQEEKGIVLGNSSSQKEKGIVLENNSSQKDKGIIVENNSSKKEVDDQEQDRYTLRIPDHVKSHIIKAHHHGATRSCTQFGDLKSRSDKGSIVLAEVCGDQDVNKL